MIKIITGIFLLLLAVVASLKTKAQEIPVFSSDSTILFISELGIFFKQMPANQQRASATLLNHISESFNNGIIESEQQQAIIETANMMRVLKLKPFPAFFTFFSASMACFAHESGSGNFMSWNNNVQKLIDEGDNRRLQDFLEQSELFFREGLLFRSIKVQWYIRNASWTMASDSLPHFAVKNGVLRCYASGDSISIYNASGIFLPGQNEWIGQKGQVKWERTNFDAEEVYANLNSYTIKLTNSTFMADSVSLQFPHYFKHLLPGTLSHSVVAGAKSESATFPRFTSYHTSLGINDVFNGIDYIGGFTLEGSRIIGYGTEHNDAFITIRKDGEQIIKLTSQNFVIRHDRISSQRAAFYLYFEDDSLYHQGLQMRYLDSDKELMLLRTEEGIGQSPFFSTYHHLDMFFEALYWKLEKNEMTLGALKGLSRESEATFVSGNFFTTYRFSRIQGADSKHPLLIINDFVKKQNSNIFYYEELANYTRLSLDQVNAMLISLSVLGFLDYDPAKGKAMVKDRIKYYLDAINNRTDYDMIRIQSKVEGTENARLNIKTFDLDIFGVPEVYLSNTQKVLVYPGDHSVKMKKGLNFIFQGSIFAGYFEFYARECAFLYDEFKINLPQIDSLAFKVPVKGKAADGAEKTERVRTIIPDISGDLLIDHPGNKSGSKVYPRYPIFDSYNDSYVYYDLPYIQNGAYLRDSFYYHILPFNIDSLNNFTTVGMSFNGSLYSGNILPVIEEPLRVQPDYSLGFVKQLSKEGLPLYGGKATAYVDVSLSYQGFRGKGKVEFLKSVSKSNDFVFLPDSMLAMLQEFDLRETHGKVYYPAVFATDVEQKWLHTDDRMILRSTKNIPFGMYNKQLVHKGILTLRSTGLFGDGEISYANAVFGSSNFNFLNNLFRADNSTLAVSAAPSGQIFKSDSYSFDFDLKLRQGRFEANNDSASVEFPANRYLAFMDSFRWEVDNKEILLSNEHTTTPTFTPGLAHLSRLDSANYPVNFVSLHSGQDSLRFAAGTARFSISELYLGIQEVPFIEVADAAIFPADGKVGILPGAVMQPLQGANLIAGIKNRYHSLYNVVATIKGRQDYTASGVYDYNDEFDKTQTIYFNHISPDSAGITVGIASIAEIEFQLNPFFDFRGDIHFYADKKAFRYDGGFRIRHECGEAVPRWVKFSGEVDKQNVVLPVSNPLYDLNGKELTVSLMFSPGYNKMYPGFMVGKQQVSDQKVLSAYGSIYFDPNERCYITGEGVSHKNKKPASGFLQLNVDACLLSGEGTIDFDPNLGQVSMLASGTAQHYILPDSTALNLFLSINFFFDANALDFLNKSLSAANLTGMDPGKEVFSSGLRRLLNEADAQRLLSELSLYGTFRRFPRELSQTMILSDVKMNWNHSTRSFTSFEPIGIATLNNQLVNRYVEGYIELIKRRTGDALTIYFQPGAGEWYFFSYSTGVMQAISSNEDFNNQIISLRESRRTIKSSSSEEPYQFIISTIQQRNTFLRRMRTN